MEEGKIKEASQIVLELEKRDDFSPKELFPFKLVKLSMVYKSGRFTEAIAHAEKLSQECQKQGDLLTYLDVLLIQAFSHIMIGNVSKTENLMIKAEDIFKKIKVASTIDLRERESFLVRIKANICTWKGEIHRSLALNKRAFELAKDSQNKELTSASLTNIAEKYDFLGNYEKAKEYAERAIKIRYQPWLIYQLGFMIDILLHKDDIKGANHYFQQISEIREKEKSNLNDILYRYYKALILKTSLRSKNRVKSEKLFKQIFDTEEITGGIENILGSKTYFYHYKYM